MTSPSEEPAWKQRAVERSIKTAKLRAAQRVQRFLDAAQAMRDRDYSPKPEPSKCGMCDVRAVCKSAVT